MPSTVVAPGQTLRPSMFSPVSIGAGSQAHTNSGAISQAIRMTSSRCGPHASSPKAAPDAAAAIAQTSAVVAGRKLNTAVCRCRLRAPVLCLPRGRAVVRDDLSLDWVRDRPDLCLIHQDGIVSAVSDALARFLGYQIDDLVGRGALELVHTDDRPYIAERIEAVYATQMATQPALQRLMHKDGRPLFVE